MRTTLDRFHIGIATEIGPLSLFPVWTEAPQIGRHRVTPAQGVAVAELDEPAVPMLGVTNELEIPVLLTEGTLLFGGLQTRVLVNDVLLRPLSRVEVEVACVEAGRWGGVEAHTISGRVPVRVIATMRDSGSQQRDVNRRDERQGRVWSNVAAYGTRYGRSNTGSLRDLMTGEVQVDRNQAQVRMESQRRALQERLRRYAQHMLPGQSGVVIAGLGHPIALEIISSPREFAHNVGALLDSFVMDVAHVPFIPTPGGRVRGWASYVMDVAIEQTAEDATSASFGTRNDYFTIQSTYEREHRSALHSLVVSTRHELILAA